ncbi:MAG: hypothetical protein LBQ09_00950 [Acidobacteriaceae bacterium]|nr:hypothetical protein [Acidobacteriaceae bacterium]
MARFSQAAAHQREAIAFVTGADEATIDVEVRPALTPAVASLVADARKTRAQADALSRDAVTLAKKAAQALAEQGFTVRDVGAALGVSFQRAHQLLTVKSAS